MTAITHKSDETDGRNPSSLRRPKLNQQELARARGNRFAGRVVGAVKPSCAGMDDKNSHGGG